jgi:hypothetical protein
MPLYVAAEVTPDCILQIKSETGEFKIFEI